MTTIQERIKELRKEKGYTQEELAKLLGLSSKSNIANYESGANSPSDKIKFKMCNIFGCSMDYLMGLTSYKKPKEELEKKLYNLNLDEAELKFLKTLFEKNSTIDISLYYLKELSEPSSLNKREIQILNAVLEIALDYIPEIENKVASDEEETKLNELIENNLVRIKTLIHSLDESKIIHNYNMLNKSFMVPIVGKIAAGKPILAQEYIEGYLPLDPNIYGLTTSDDLFYLRVSGQSMNLKVKNGDYALIRKQDYAEDGDIIAAIVNGDNEATLKRYKKLTDRFVLLEPMSTDPSIEAITVDLKNTDFKIIGKAIGQFGKF